MTSSTSKAHDPHLIMGYTTRRHLLLDLDNTPLSKSIRLTRSIQREWPNVGDALIAKSSAKPPRRTYIYTRQVKPTQIRRSDSYHVVFDNQIGYNTACRILTTLSGLDVIDRKQDRIREFRGDMTLRISPTTLMYKVKHEPKPLGWVHNPYCQTHDGYIHQYLEQLDIAVSVYTKLGVIQPSLFATF